MEKKARVAAVIQTSKHIERQLRTDSSKHQKEKVV